MKGSVVGTCTWVAAGVVAVPSLYLGILTAAGSVARPRAHSTGPRTTRFVICVPAHNEEAVIGDTVQALTQQSYPTALYQIHVVADNCTDRTADLAAHAAATVHVRNDVQNPGKGAALNWLHDRLPHAEFDVLVVVDADTVADSGMLAAFDRAFSEGAAVVQGHYGVKDPATSPAVSFRYAALACRHHLRPLGRKRIGASCGLYGNGMAFRADVIGDRRWSNHLVEDAELQIELLLDGVIVTYAPDAMLWAEMPDTSEASQTQNERWELGRMQVVRASFASLLRRSIAGGRLPRRTYVDAIFDQITPPLSLLAVLDAAVVGSGLLAAATSTRHRINPALVGGLVSGAVLAVHVLTALKLVEAPRAVYRSLRSAPRLVAWKVLLLARVARRPAAVSWTRTRRNEVGAPT